MADDTSKAGDGRPRSDRPTPKTGERPFDMWLQKQLHAMYDEITNEPLPDDLLTLIDKDAAREKQNGTSDSPPVGKK
ncbi:NepR family anti-sigma factor [Reyranella massiliensis]|uniref:NepR family anti-sigma factor n=1 Tax=Reyranella massiliensis TaxID=445220 RepID=UPI000A003335|nr:NepR family anti-sigma factor [Reyranella massiliensis]